MKHRSLVVLAACSMLLAPSTAQSGVPVIPRPFAAHARAAAPLQSASAVSAFDSFWSEGFGLPLLDGIIYAIADYGGQPVIGGSFTAAALTHASGVAAWNGLGWDALGTGVGSTVRALQPYAGGLVSGSVLHFDATTDNTIQLWNGTSWSVLGATDGGVYALTLFGGDLIAGGVFTHVNGVAATGVARWDGSAWHALGSGVAGSVHALAAHAGQLVAAGGLTGFDGVAAWNGATWAQLGAGLQFSGSPAFDVASLVSDGTSLFAVGGFDQSGATSCLYGARWNGTSWSGAPGVGTDTEALGLWQGAAATTNGVGAALGWNGSAWSFLGNPTGVGAKAVHQVGAKLYFGAGGLTEYDGATWQALSAPWSPGMRGLNSVVHDAVAWNGKLIVAGGFTLFGASDHFVAARSIAAWDGSTWSNVGTPQALGGPPIALATWQNDLIAGGAFGSAGGVTTRNITRWNGATWSALGPGVNNWVLALGTYGSDLIASGFFTTSGSTALNGIGRWDGTSWHPLGSGFTDPETNWAYAMAEWNGMLVLAGDFSDVGGVSANKLAAWNGSTYSEFGGGLNAAAYALTVFGGDLVAGGDFTLAGGVPVHGVARWNGSSWTPMGSSANYVTRFSTVGGRLFAFGEFEAPGGGYADDVAVWTGTDWLVLGSGVEGFTNTMAPYGGDLYIGGGFGWANGHIAFNIARLTQVAALGVPPEGEPLALALNAAPNPGREVQRLDYALPQAGRVRLTVLDLAGRRLATLAEGEQGPGAHHATWNGVDDAGRLAPAGLYFARIEIGSLARTIRVVRMR